MNKELKALEILKNITIIKDFEDEKGVKRIVFASEVYEEQFKIIEAALKSPIIQDNHYVHIKYGTFSDMQKKIKALEIIQEKEVNVFIFLHSGDLATYNDMVEDNRKLTQEEYDLLKEALL